jgi:DNA-binding CsgD family transcriptional regulator
MAWKHRTITQERQIVGLSASHTQREIAKLLDVSQWTVHDVQRKYHITHAFGREHVARRRYAYDEHVWGRIIETLYIEQRLSLAETASRCGIDVGTLRRRMGTLGIPIRTTAESNRGTTRGRYKGWLDKLPRCSAGCGRGVLTPGETECSTCRRKTARRALRSADAG